jgi:putative hydrolase of the HAD superfamily
MAKFSHIRHWVFDLDGTLYPKGNAYFNMLFPAYADFAQQHHGLTAEEARKVTEVYGGQRPLSDIPKHIKNTPEESKAWLQYTEKLDFSSLEPCRQTHSYLAKIEHPKTLFTNSTYALSQRVLAKLGYQEQFSDILGIDKRGYLPKHVPEAYENLRLKTGLDPDSSVLVEDSSHNLEMAKDFGFTTVLVYGESDASYVDHHYPDLLSFLREAV